MADVSLQVQVTQTWWPPTAGSWPSDSVLRLQGPAGTGPEEDPRIAAAARGRMVVRPQLCKLRTLGWRRLLVRRSCRNVATAVSTYNCCRF